MLDSCSSVWRALQTWAPSDGPMVSVITPYKSGRRQHGVQRQQHTELLSFPPESKEALLLGFGHIWNARHSTVFKIRLDYCQEEWSSSLPGQLIVWEKGLLRSQWSHVHLGTAVSLLTCSRLELTFVKFGSVVLWRFWFFKFLSKIHISLLFWSDSMMFLLWGRERERERERERNGSASS